MVKLYFIQRENYASDVLSSCQIELVGHADAFALSYSVLGGDAVQMECQIAYAKNLLERANTKAALPGKMLFENNHTVFRFKQNKCLVISKANEVIKVQALWDIEEEVWKIAPSA